MAKRVHEQEGEESIVAKSKPTMNLVSRVSTSLRQCKIRLRRRARGYSTNLVEQIGQVQGNLKQENSIEKQRRVLKDAKKDAVLDVSARRLVTTEEDQEHPNFSEDSIRSRRLVASGNSETEGEDLLLPGKLSKLQLTIAR